MLFVARRERAPAVAVAVLDLQEISQMLEAS
jgi:hypothetical protein